MAVYNVNQIKERISNSSLGQKVSSSLTSLAVGILELQYYLAAQREGVMNVTGEGKDGNVYVSRGYEADLFPWPNTEIKHLTRERGTLEGIDEGMFHVLDKPYIGIPVALALNVLPTLAVYWATGRIFGTKKEDYQELRPEVKPDVSDIFDLIPEEFEMPSGLEQELDA